MKPISIKNTKFTNRTSESFGKYLNKVQAIPLLSSEEEKDLAYKIVSGDTKAKDELIRRNLRFVISVANIYQDSDIPFEDLVNEGNIGLTLAAESFNPDKDVKFISYAVWHVRKYISKYIREHQRTIRIPSDKFQNILKFTKQSEKLSQKLGRPAEPEELVEEFADDLAIRPNLKNLTVEKAIREYNHLQSIIRNNPDSLSRNIDDESDSAISDTIADTMFINQDEIMIQSEFKAQLHQYVDRLKPKQKAVITALYGLDNGEEIDCSKLSEMLGISKQRISQIHMKALKQLREIITKDTYK